MEAAGAAVRTGVRRERVEGMVGGGRGGGVGGRGGGGGGGVVATLLTLEAHTRPLLPDLTPLQEACTISRQIRQAVSADHEGWKGGRRRGGGVRE